MKSSLSILAICAGTVLFAAGCSKTDDAPMSKVAERAPSAQETSSKPALPSPPLPEINAPKGVEEPAPHPGQGNDTSSPAFVNGGKADPHK